MAIVNSTTLVTVTLFVIVYTVGRAIQNYVLYHQKRVRSGCQDIRRYPSWDWVMGMDYVYAMLQALKQDRFLDFQSETYGHGGPAMWTANFMGNRMLYSSIPDNMKAMSTSLINHFAVEPIRVGNGAITPLTGRGVSSSDGEKWQWSRDLIKPYFDRAAFTNLDRLNVHVERLISKIPSDGSTVDMQPLFQRWFLDSSTDHLFGETVNSLDDPTRDGPNRDMVLAMAGLRLRLQLSSFIFLHRDAKWFAACRRIRKYLDGHIDRAYQQLEDERRGKPATYEDGRPRDDFLWTIARHVPDKDELRTQLMGVWIPSNETTSILMSNVVYALARHPKVVERLREEIQQLPDGPITFENLRSLNYLRWTINETHRLYPVSLQTVRACVKDTVLPTGGGPDGSAPVFCAKGDILHCNRYLMHRDQHLWGDDATEFLPERWEHARPLWSFVPFGGGPRICPAHVMVDTECSYMIVRLLQRFVRIEARDPKPYTAIMRVGPSSKYGCQVGFVPADQLGG